MAVRSRRTLLWSLGLIMPLVAACSCGEESREELDGGFSGDAVRPRDAALPCRDQRVALRDIDTHLLEMVPERRMARAAADGSSLVLAWQDVLGYEDERWRGARVSDPRHPVAEPLPPFPMPGVVTMFPIDAGVRIVLRSNLRLGEPVNDGAMAIADLASDDTFGPMVPFELGTARVFGGSACDGLDAVGFYSLEEGTGDQRALLLLDTTGGTPQEYEEIPWPGACPVGTRPELLGCASSGEIVSLLARPCMGPPAVARWRADEGTPLGNPIALGSGAESQSGLAVVGPSGQLVFFVLGGDEAPEARAYRVVGGSAEPMARRRLDDPFGVPHVRVIGAFTIDARIVLVYRQPEYGESAVLSAIGFSEDAGFEDPVIVGDTWCGKEPGAQAQELPTGAYLPCARVGAGLGLLAMCEGEER